MRYSSRVISWNCLLPSLVKSMSTLGLPVVLSKPARALLTASPVIAGGRAYTNHCSGMLVGGVRRAHDERVVRRRCPPARSCSISAFETPWSRSCVRAASLLSTGPTGRDSGSSLKNSSWAVLPITESACSASVMPGSAMAIWSAPCVWICDSVTPRPLTRRSRIPTVWSSCACVGRLAVGGPRRVHHLEPALEVEPEPRLHARRDDVVQRHRHERGHDDEDDEVSVSSHVFTTACGPGWAVRR